MWKQKILIVTTIRRKERMNQEEKGELGDALAKMCLASRKTRYVFQNCKEDDFHNQVFSGISNSYVNK